MFELGDYDITVVLTDPYGAYSNFQFKFSVFEIPKLTGPLAKNIEIMASNEVIYRLPVRFGMLDEYVTHDTTLPTFILFIYPLYIFRP